MIVIGELINATRRSIAQAIEKRDRDYIKKIAKKQIESGAHYIDLNAGTGKGQEREVSDMGWLVDIVNELGDIPICLDSSDPLVIKENLGRIKSSDRMINSINGESERIERLMPVIKENNKCKVVGLTMDNAGIPTSVEKRIEITEKVLGLLQGAGVKREDVFIDALVQPISVDVKNGNMFLESVREIKTEFPGVKTTCGLSNVSFGLPNRKLLNKYFLALSIDYGLDSAIMDPTDDGMREAIRLADVLTGKDDYCMNYIKVSRESSR
jgi:5-methyltetrahydrofolate corrinoid/iron sulfur protein methyltransferase